MFSRIVSGAFALSLCFSSATFANCGSDYVVRSGDTLTQIARSTLGSVFEFTRIHRANLDVIGHDPSRVEVGSQLYIPCQTALEDMNWSVMPDLPELMRLRQLEEVQVLDIRSVKLAKKGMLPNSINMPYSVWRNPTEDTSKPATAEEVASIVGWSGLQLDRPIVIVHHKPTPMDIGRAAYVYWLLKSSGAEQLAILKGGYNAWKKQGLATSVHAAKRRPYEAEVTFDVSWRADTLDIYAIATDQVPGLLVDARPHSIVNRFNKLGEAMATTLPTARNAPVDQLASELIRHVSVEEGAARVVEHLKKHHSLLDDGMIVSFCKNGELAALNWFYMAEIAGMSNSRLFPESLKGWTADGGKLFKSDTFLDAVHAVVR